MLITVFFPETKEKKRTMDVYKQLAIFAVILAAYLNWPISPIPRSLYEWRIKGDFYKYGNYKIFYRGRYND